MKQDEHERCEYIESTLFANESEKWTFFFCDVFYPSGYFRRMNPIALQCPSTDAPDEHFHVVWSV